MNNVKKKNESKILNTECEQLTNLIGNYKLGTFYDKFQKKQQVREHLGKLSQDIMFLQMKEQPLKYLKKAKYQNLRIWKGLKEK